MTNNIQKELIANIVISFILLAAGIIYCLYYGRIGYMPQDSPTVFDGGWRLLSGQIPFRDFTLPNAIVPIFIQSFFFKIFSVNWFVYCLHAAVFNGLFCVLVFFFLRMFEGSLQLSFFYALMSSVVFYPPFGVPVQDQHAYFFTFLLIFFVCLALRVSNPWLKQLIFFFLPLVATIAFLSKQIPTVFGIALGGLILLVAEQKNLIRLMLALIAGTLAVILLLIALYHVLEINFELVKVYYFQLPAGTGSERLIGFISGMGIYIIGYMFSHWQIFSPFIIVTILFLGTLFCVWRGGNTKGDYRWKIFEPVMENAFFPLFLAQCLLIICYLFVTLTCNAFENGISLIFISSGLAHISLSKLSESHSSVNQPFRFLRKNYVLYLLSLILIVSSLLCAWSFDRQVNANRMVHDFIYKDKDNKHQKAEMPEALSFLVWGAPNCYHGTPDDFKQLINFFQQNEGNFYLVGDSSIVYALTGRPSVNPVLWFHPGQTIPRIESPLFPAFQDRLMEALLKFNIKYIVLEETRTHTVPTTWSGVNLGYFPALTEIVEKEGRKREQFGPFTIIELVKPIGELITVRNGQ